MTNMTSAVAAGTDTRLVTATTEDGVVLHGALSGTATRGGVLAVHGAWGNFYASPPAAMLAAAPPLGLAVLSLNGRGHDMGGLDDGAPSIGWLQERLELAPLDLAAARDLLAEAGVERYLVVAHSYGCARAAYWLRHHPDPRCAGLALLSPPPQAKHAWEPMTDFDVEPIFATARAAVEAGEAERLILMRADGPVPLIASAGTIMSVWAPGTQAFCELHLDQIGVPTLVVVGRREKPPFHGAAERAAAASPRGELLVVEEDHFYRQDRPGLTRSILGWAESQRIWD